MKDSGKDIRAPNGNFKSNPKTSKKSFKETLGPKQAKRALSTRSHLLVPGIFLGNCFLRHCHMRLAVTCVTVCYQGYYRIRCRSIIFHAAGTSINFALCEEIKIFCLAFTMVVYEKIFGSINK